MAQGRYAEAELNCRDALRIRQKSLGPDHPDTAGSQYCLADLYCHQGRYTDAELLYRDALLARQKAIGPGHPRTAWGLLNMVKLYYEQGNHAEAEPLLLRAAAAHEAARLVTAHGIDRAVAEGFPPYRALAVSAAARGNPRAAFAALKQQLARGLLDELTARSPAALTPDEAARRDRLVTDLARLQPRVLYLAPRHLPTAAEQAELDALAAERSKLEGHLAELAVSVSRRGVADLTTIQAAMPADSAWAVCLSLWAVDDTATALLMGRFYQNLLGKRPGLAGPMPKAAALAEAKQWLREFTAEEAL